MKNLVGLLLRIALVGGFLFALYKTDPYISVKSGETELYCFLKDQGWTYVPHEKVSGYIDDENIWVFKNGYSRQCKLIRKEE